MKIKLITGLLIIVGAFFPLAGNVKAETACTSVPISGNYTVTATTPGCYITPASQTGGLDNSGGSETSTTNNAVLTVASNAILTIPSGVGSTTSLAVGSLSISNGGSITIGSNANMLIGSPLYMGDADADGFAASLSQYYTATASGRRRKSLARTLSAADCNDSKYLLSNTCSPTTFGDGHDGACTVSANININTGTCVGKATADGINYAVSAIGATTVTTAATPTGIAVNDEVLLINLRGSSTNYANVGTYESFLVESINGTTLTFVGNVTKTFGVGGNSDLTGQKIMLQRVPNYTNVTVNSTYNFTPTAWDGTKNGVMAFRANGTVNVVGKIHANALGYRNGVANTATNGKGYGGEAFCEANSVAGGNGANAAYSAPNWTGISGVCGGGGGGSTWVGYVGGGTGGNGSSLGGAGGGGGGTYANNYDGAAGGGGGGGYGTGGAGSKYASSSTKDGTDGTTSSGAGGTAYCAGSNCHPEGGGGGGGGTYGVSTLTSLFFGSGGGGGGGSDLNTNTIIVNGGKGGKGGGIVMINASTLTISGTISSNGEAGTAGTSDSSGAGGAGGGGGGGSGGSVLLTTSTSTLGTSLVLATGGAKGDNTYFADGGAGGVGRIAIQGSITGTTNPTYTSF